MSCEIDDYPTIKQKQRDTWDSITRMDVDTIYYYSGTTTELVGDRLTLNIGEGHGYFYMKTILAFKYMLMADKDWDYIFKTDNSAYVHKKELVRVLASKPRKQYYGGHLYKTTYMEADPFLWGEGLALSRDVVEYIVEQYEHTTIGRSGSEDVHIGMVLNGIFPWDTSLTICEYHRHPLVLTHTYRCKKEGSEQGLQDQLNAMDAIHEFLYPASQHDR